MDVVVGRMSHCRETEREHDLAERENAIDILELAMVRDSTTATLDCWLLVTATGWSWRLS
jgi:hypothetical protein